MAQTKAKAKSKTTTSKKAAAATKRRGRPARKKTRKRKAVRRRRTTRSAVSISGVTAELKRAGVPQSSIAALVADLKKQGRRDQLNKDRAKLQAQADKLSAKVAKIDGQLAALDGQKRRKTTAAKASPARKGGRSRGARSAVKADAVLRVLGKNKGKALLRAEVASALGADTSKVGAALAALLAAGKIKRSGQRRGTRYSV